MNELASQIFTSLDITEVVISICTIVVTWVLTKVGSAFNRKAEAQEGNEKAISAEKAFRMLSEVCDSIVNYYNNSIVEKIKESSADGKLTKAEAEQIVSDAARDIVGIVGPNVMDTLKEYFEDTDALIRSLIEKYVNANKTSKTEKDSLKTDIFGDMSPIHTIENVTDETESFSIPTNADTINVLNTNE